VRRAAAAISPQGTVPGQCNGGAMDKKRVRVLISGRVQGVFFRAYTRDTAIQEGLSGWVRNLADGRVEAVFEGNADQVDRMIAWCHQGSPGSRVGQVEVHPQPYQGELTSFEIRYRSLE
jgi:acylphosphatase